MYRDFHLLYIIVKKFGSHLNVQNMRRINTLQNMCWHIYSHHKEGTLKEYLRDVKRLTSLSG